jgi:hypothetical protein
VNWQDFATAYRAKVCGPYGWRNWNLDSYFCYLQSVVVELSLQLYR